MRPGRRRARPRAGRKWRVRLGRWFRMCLEGLAGMSGMIVNHSAASTELIALMDRMELDASPPLLPPGHPERAVPGVPPNAVELALWAQLTPPVRRAQPRL